MISEVHNIDCVAFMATLPDKFFDLAFPDVNYGIGEDGKSNNSRGGTLAPATQFKEKDWDNDSPPVEYFDELFRVSKNQIIWGANHFIEKIPINSSCWIVWDKLNGTSDFADCELAWTSFPTAVRKLTYRWNGWGQGNLINGKHEHLKEKRIHPTQKPTYIFKWLLTNYANPGDKIFDSHMGSQSSRIAAYDKGFDYWGCERDFDYFRDGCKRFEIFKSQLKLF